VPVFVWLVVLVVVVLLLVVMVLVLASARREPDNPDAWGYSSVARI
jgi:cation transporter-like permease